LDYDFDPEAPTPRGWLAFLGQVFPEDKETQAALQELFGYLLTNNTRHHVIGMFIGPPRAGKGTAVRVLNRLIASANVTSPSMADLGGPFGLWSLMGKSLAVINDARLSARTDKGAVLERLLSISGEDNVSVNRKNLSPVETRLKCHLLIVTNELPQLHDESGALASRLRAFLFTQSFEGREDRKLTDKLLSELP